MVKNNKGVSFLMKEIAILGGDLRIVKLAQMLTEDNIKIKTYALEEAKILHHIPQIKHCASIEEALQGVSTVIGPIPLSNNGVQINTPFSKETIFIEQLVEKLNKKQFLAGSIKKEFYDLASKQDIQIIDLLEKEELVVLNTIATAEGAIQIAMEETTKTIHSSNILVLGFGRVGKTLAYMLKGIGANVFCEARKEEDFAWIKTYGYQKIELKELKNTLHQFDIIMNTVPSILLKQEELSCLKKDCLLVDLASKPGGIDIEEARKQGIKTIWALALPGKVAPHTSAEYIKNTIYHVLQEKEQ